MAVVAVLLPSLARREGLDSMGLAAIASLPFLAGLLTLFAGRIGPGTPKRLALLRAAGALGLLTVLVAPHPVFLAVATLGFWVSFALGTPLQQRIWASIYPSAERGRFLGLVTTSRFAAGTLALLAITVAAASGSWMAVVAVVAIAAAVSALAVSRLAVPGIQLDHRFSAASSIRAALGSPMMRRIVSAQLLFGGGLVAAPALVAMVNVDRLGLDVEDIALAGLIGYGVTALSSSAWGRAASRVGALPTIAAGTFVGAVAVGTFAFAPDFAAILYASALLGVAGAAVDVSWPLLVAEHAGADQQASAAAGLNAIMGLRGLITPFVVMAPIQAGLVDETGGLVLCLAAVAGGSLVYAHLAGAHLPAGIHRLTGGMAQLRPASALRSLSWISG